MFQRLLLTLATAVSLTGLYLLYSIALRPVVVLPALSERSIEDDQFEDFHRPAENVRVATTYLPVQKWAAESKYMLKAESAFVYTESWRRDPGNDKRIRFDKFAMAWVSNDKNGVEQAVSIASDSALLEFASVFDEKNQNPGRVVRAVLSGHVEIAGPDGLEIVGRNFIFDESELNLYTTNPVNFRFQSHRGRASRMSMKLIPAEGLPGMDRPHIYGVESIRLVANPADPKTPHVRLEVQMPQGKEMKRVNVKCAGDLEYFVGTTTAVFTKNVIAWTGPTDNFDWLECERLTLQFIPTSRSSTDVTIDSKLHPKETQRLKNEYQHFERDLEFSVLVAEGPQVKIVSKSQGVRARMTRLTYRADTRVLSMISEGSERDVRLLRRGSELKVPKIEARLDEQNSLSSLICRGAGELRYVDEMSGKLTFVATWQKQLSKKTDGATKLDLVELEERAQFRQPHEGTGLGAELIKIWLVPVPFNLSPPSPEVVATTETPDPQPRRLLASGNVVLASPQMSISRTNELNIRFDEEVGLKSDSVTQRSRSQLQLVALTTSSDSAKILTIPDGTLGPPIDIPYEFEPSPKSQTQTKDKSAPIIVSADRIGVRMRRSPGRQEPEVMHVHCEGKVEISQSRIPGEKPLELAGDRVDLENESKDHEIVHVFGAPAKIHDQRFKIEGKEIHLDRGENRAWVRGSGWLKLPIPPQARIPGLDAAASRDLNVNWNESMDFDGLESKFIGRVRATLGLGSMRCEQMSVQLMERLSFQTASADSKPAIRTIYCRENVSFENSKYLAKKVIDKYRGRVGEFTWNHSTGDVIAQGPGIIQAWQRQKKENSEFSPRDTIQANRPIPVEISEWNYTRVKFEGQLKGHIDGELTGATGRQNATIDDRVEVTHGPVKSPSEEVHPDDLPSNGGTMRCDRLQFVNRPKSERNPIEYTELVGLGNSEVEGQVNERRFTASADEISFDGSKGLYVLRSHGRQSARLNGIGTGNLISRRIEFNPKLKTLKVERAIDGQGSQSR